MASHTEPSCYWPQAFISEPSYYWPHALLTSPVITGLVLNYWAQFLLASGLFVAWPTSCCAFITEPSSYWPQAYLWPGPHHVAHLLLSPVLTGLRLICGLAHIMLLIYYWAQLLLASGLFVAWPTSCYYVAHIWLSPVITGLRLICGLAHIMLLCCAYLYNEYVYMSG